jgi:7 transmembrane sweet-taste receptor of 3 GCPR/Bacterial extracellular solute-binding protein
LLFWNRDMVRDVLGEERPPETWAELKEWARQINQTLPDVWGLGAQMAGGDVAHFFTPMAHSYGASWFDDEGKCNARSEEMEQALTYWTSLYKEGLSPHHDGSFLEYDQMFLDQKLAFYMSGSWQYWSYQPFLGDVLGLSALPSGEIGQFQFLAGEGMALAAASKNPREAWDFMRFLTDPVDGWGLQLQNIGIPSRRTIVTKEFCAESVLDNFNWDPVRTEIGALLRAVPLQFPNENSPTVRLIEAWETLPQHLQAINLDQMTVSEAAESMCAWMDEQIELIYEVILPITDLSSYEVPLTVVISIFMALVVIGAVLTFIYRENAFIRCASPLFLMFIWLGALLGYSSLYTWAFEATQTSCIFKYWLGACGFVILFAALFAKTWRVWRLFSNKEFRALQISNVHVMLMVVGFLSVQVLILLLWTSINTPDVEYVEVNNDERQLQCTSDNYWVWLGLTYGYLASIVLVGAVLAFLSRKAARAFNETRQIAFSIYAVMVIGGIVVPLVHALDDSPDAVVILAVAGGVAGTTVVLAAIFLPKFIPIFQGKEASREDITGYNHSTANRSSMLTSSPPGSGTTSGTTMGTTSSSSIG